jgi:hypothetical protein
MTVHFILGLCGAGKTTLVQSLKSIYPQLKCFMADRDTRYYYRKLRRALFAGKDCIVEDICMCLSPYRHWMESYLSTVAELKIHYIAFENNVRACNWNCAMRRKRDPRAHLRINRRLHYRYTIPGSAKILPVLEFGR